MTNKEMEKWEEDFERLFAHYPEYDFWNKTVKYFIGALLQSAIHTAEKRMIKEMLKNFGKGNYMDKQADNVDCRNCYIKGFNDCMKKLRETTNYLKRT